MHASPVSSKYENTKISTVSQANHTACNSSLKSRSSVSHAYTLTLGTRGEGIPLVAGQAAAVGPVALGEALRVLAAHQEQAGLLAAALVANLIVLAFVMQGTFCQGLNWEGINGDIILYDWGFVKMENSRRRFGLY